MRRKEDDLRWRRTERNLMEAFGRMLEELPVGKISVTALAREADINKATFYLHYSDVFALAEAYAAMLADDVVSSLSEPLTLLSDPQGFVAEFMDALAVPERHARAHLLAENDLVLPLLMGLNGSMRERLRNCEEYAQDTSEALVTFLFMGLMGALQQHLGQDRYALASDLSRAVAALVPLLQK